ncbi:hypothetical protein RJ640_025499 [Escallonia rubra]|uniref:Reverse transcriptase Ty1/copia-type domain-containing protein n=1 Tax=Escallonia rubra TaxID=112253 RepID=A0AA88U2M2_9ASTE|nr:hypothetical protein RJ640_025499 [Escallonia rubra]
MKDQKALSLIQLGIDDDIFEKIVQATSAKRALDTLENVFKGIDKVKKENMGLFSQAKVRGVLNLQKVQGSCGEAEWISDKAMRFDRARSVWNQTPQEAWSGFKPSVSHLKVFGSIAYVHVPDQQRKKLDDKSEKFIFIGYSQESKGYKLYNPIDKKMKVSRDVTFDEKSSWDWTDQDKEQYTFDDFKKEMAKVFELTDIGLMSYYLGIEVKQIDDGIFISQEAYAKEVLKMFNMENCNPISIPIESMKIDLEVELGSNRDIGADETHKESKADEELFPDLYF